MGTNKYGHIGAIESGHATYATNYVHRGDGFSTRGEFTPWTVRHNTEWHKVPFGTTAADMIQDNPLLRSHVEAIGLDEWMLGVDLAGEHQAMVRYDEMGNARLLGTKMTDGLIQSRDVADMVDTFVEAAKMAGFGDAGVITAFEMDMGKRFVVCADLTSAEWFGGSLSGMVTGMTSWDGSWKSKLIESVVVSQCTNTVSMNLFDAVARNKKRGRRGEEVLIAFKNTKGVQERWATAARLVQAMASKWVFFSENAHSLVETPITDGTFRKLVGDVLGERPEPKKPNAKGQCPAENWDAKFSAIVSEWRAPHNEYARNTAWGAVMAANGYDLWLDGARDVVKSQVNDLYEGDSAITSQMMAAVAEATAWAPTQLVDA